MLKLTDFFAPLNFFTISYFVALFIFFDILGTFIKGLFINEKKVNLETRLVNWLIGISFFVFLWFLVGFVIEANRNNLLLSIFLILMVTLPSYIKDKEYLGLFRFVKPLIVPILLLIPFLPTTFVQASLPPYYSDEMAYHFISPYTMLHQLRTFWTFAGGTLMNAPRMMDNLYILTFSLTHTYSVVRLMQFFMLVTALFYGFLFIRKILGNVPAFLFILIFLSLPLNIPLNSTVGYVDVPAYSFMLLGFLTGLGFAVQERKEYLIFSSIFWGMSIGTKYTTFMPFAIFVVVITIVYWIKHKSLRIFFDWSMLFKVLLALIIFGGYWYVKNFVVYGNPIYPFLFPCWGKYAIDCQTGSSFFGDWTVPINTKTFFPIITELLPGNIFLYIALLFSPVLLLIFGNKKSKYLVSIMISLFLIELLSLKYFSGFFLRYQQHLLFVLIFAIAMLASVKFKNRLLKFMQFSVIGLVVISSFISYYKNTRSLGTPLIEKNYALGTASIYDWVNFRLPGMSNIAIWCQNPPGGVVRLARYDPDTIWYNDDTFINSFLVNCYWGYPNLDSSEWGKLTQVAKERKLQFWTVSVNQCISEDKIEINKDMASNPYQAKDAEIQFLMRKMNDAIVCNSERLFAGLYYFDYRRLKQ